MRRVIRDNGLSITMFALFLVFLVAQSIAGYKTTNSENEQHRQPKESYAEYLTSGEFVEATFENWESEFLQMGAYVLLTAFLIQKGSPESKNPDGTTSTKIRASSKTTRRLPARSSVVGWF
jgi:hypothetical protein